MNRAETIASIFGSLVSDIKKLNKWENIEYNHLKDGFKIEKQIFDLKQELLSNRQKYNNNIKKVDKTVLKKFGGQNLAGVALHSIEWWQDIRKIHSTFYQNVNKIQEKIKKDKKELFNLESKLHYSVNLMIRDVNLIYNSIMLLKTHLKKIKQIIPNASFNRLESIVSYIDTFIRQLLENLSKLSQAVAEDKKNHNLQSIKEDAYILREYLNEQEIKIVLEEIESIENELKVLKYYTEPRNVSSNVYNYHGTNYSLYGSKKVLKILNSNYAIVAKLLDKLDRMIATGISMMRTGESNIETNMNRNRRLLKGKFLRFNLETSSRIIFEIKDNNIYVYEIFAQGEHDYAYIECSNRIKRDQYDPPKTKEKLNLFIKIAA